MIEYFLELCNVLCLLIEPVTKGLPHGMAADFAQANLRSDSVKNLVSLNPADRLTAFPGGEQVITVVHSGNVLVNNASQIGC